MIPVIQSRNAKLFIANSPLVTDAIQFSYLVEPAVVGDAQIFLQDYTGFADNQILIIEDLGAETAEIVTVNGTPTVNGGAVLDAVLVRSHPEGARVYILDYDQIELSHSVTATGSKVVLTLNSGIVSIQPDTKTQVYNESEFSTGYYFSRYKNSITGLFSGYSDALIFGGWDKNTVGYMIGRALRDVAEELNKKVTRFDCYEWITTCLKLIQGKLKRWPEHYSYNAVFGQTARGVNSVTLPTDIYDNKTNKSLIAVRVGDQGKLQYLSPVDFKSALRGVRVTPVTTQATAGQVTLAINNSYDFEDAGTVSVYVAGVKYSITYTGVTRSASAGVLTGIPASGTGSISVTIPAATSVWQNETEGIPIWFTVEAGALVFWPLVDSGSDNMNLYGDYSHVATAVDSDGDTIDLQRYDAVQAYLTWRIKMKAKNNGTLDQNDGYYLMYKESLNDGIRTLPSNNLFRVRPSVNRIGNMRNMPRRASVQDLPIDQQ